MNTLELFKLKQYLLQEIGEATTQPYDWTQTGNGEQTKRYRFTTDADLNYMVEIRLLYYEVDANEPDYASVEFSVIKKGEDGDYHSDYYVSTNKGELYRIMSTVVDILKDLLNKNKSLKYIEFEADKEGKDNSQRANLYSIYVKKQLPNAEIERQQRAGFEKVVIKIDKEEEE